MSERETDLKLLNELLAHKEQTRADGEPLLSGKEEKAFSEMLENLDRFHQLTDKQRQWVMGVHERVIGTPQYLNMWSSGTIPRGKEVPEPKALQYKPLRPPPRRPQTDD
jgi:hypothetical protein